MNIKQITLPLYEAKGWMKFLGVMMIIMGVMIALSIVGLVIAWLPIWMGVLLFQAAGKADAAYVGEDEALLIASLGKVKTFFVINGVLMLIYLIIIGVTVIKGIGMLGMMGMYM